jgi:hypothetical protein
MLSQDELDWHSVVASVVGCEMSELKDSALAPLHEELPDCGSAPRSMKLEFNSSFNLVTSNWCIADRNFFSSSDQEDSKTTAQDYTSNSRYTTKTHLTHNESRSPKSETSDLILSPQSVYVPQDSRFFVIKSFTEADVKTSFMHKVWSSTDLGNKRLNKAYTARHSNERIFLFFSVNGSGKFCGIAEMISPLLETKESPIWMEKSRWRGEFKVQWLYVKDIYNNHFRQLKVPQNEWKSVTSSRDTQELPTDVGKQMLEIFKRTQSQTSFLQN